MGSNGATNGISIHGCSPSMLLWRVEGVEVPNPNHFADITGAGAGVFSSLSSLVLGNSDFITGAAPAEYGNTISGVFDMKMRTGNNSHRETAVQVGTLVFLYPSLVTGIIDIWCKDVDTWCTALRSRRPIWRTFSTT